LVVPAIPTPAESDQSDATVSDLDSDLEPNQLVPTYLKIKGKLFEIDPESVDVKPKKTPKGGKGRNSKPLLTVQSPAVRKLRSQLQQLESDALFDVETAEAQWPAQRNILAQNKAAQRRDQLTVTDSDVPEASPALDEDDADLLGDMFSAIPEGVVPSNNVNEKAPDNIILRDFGKQSGLVPRKLLEEVIRSRFVTCTSSETKVDLINTEIKAHA
jgi:ATP-dependent RNA helicase DHX29